MNAVNIVPQNLNAPAPLRKRLWCAGAETARLRIRMLALFFVVFITGAHTVAQVANLVNRLEQAAALIADNRVADAEKQLSSILRDVPNEPAALNLLGTIRAKQGRLPEAETFFLRAVRGDHKYVGAHMNLAHLYMLMGQPKNSIAELKKVLLLSPGNVEAVDRLARLLLSQGEIEEGIKTLERAEQSQPLSAALLVLLGDAYLRRATQLEPNRVTNSRSKGRTTTLMRSLVWHRRHILKGDASATSLYLARARKMEAKSPDTLYRFALVALEPAFMRKPTGLYWRLLESTRTTRLILLR